MSKYNYMEMSNEEFIKLIDDVLSKFKMNFYGRILKTHHKAMFDEIVRRTSFLDENHMIPFTARLYCIRNNLYSNPICSCDGCQNTVEWRCKYNIYILNQWCYILTRIANYCVVLYHVFTSFKF